MPSTYKSPSPLGLEVERALTVFNVNQLRAGVIRDLSKHPEGDTTGNIARRLEVDYRQVYAHVRILLAEGLVVTDADGVNQSGRRVLYSLKPGALEQQLAAYGKFLMGE